MPHENSELLDDFDAYYRMADAPVMRRIEAAVTGSNYGASSYTTRVEADRLAELLGLGPGRLLLDFGTGAGWPGIYLAASTGCRLIATDVPFEGLRTAGSRMGEEGVRGVAIVASAATLPIRDEALDAATSSDVFC